MSVKTYNPEEVSVIIGGSIIKSWNKVTIECDEDEFFFTVGTSGETTRTKNASKLNTITLINPQTSEDNDIMSAFQLLGSLIPCAIRDNGGTSLHIMPEGTIVKSASKEYAKEAGETEWQIKGEIMGSIVGGNN